MADPLVLDCWAAYGRRPGKDVEERWTLDHLLDDMDFYGIGGALVRHEQGSYYDASYTNRKLMHEIREHRDRLFPCWSVMPHQTGEFCAPDELLREMRGDGVKAIFLRPTSNVYPIHEDVLRPLADTLNPVRILILTTLRELGHSYDMAVRFCRIFHNCPVIIGEASWDDWRLMTAIMDACPNVRMEFHAFQANRAVEAFTERYGVERILFGSGLLPYSAGGARGYIDWSLLDDESVARYAGGNLSKLIGVSGCATPAIRPDADELIIAARHGRPMPCPVLDAHSHVVHDGLNSAGMHYTMKDGDIAHMHELAERMGLDVAGIMSWNGPVSMDVEDGNALVESVISRYPDFAVGLGTCDPSHQTREEIERLCERLYPGLGFRGMKPYLMNDISYASPKYDPFWETCNKYKLYGLMHTNPRAGDMAAVCDLAKRYPDATFVIAHTGQSWSMAREVADVALLYPNVVAELTYTSACNGLIEWLCKTIGSDRVLFGTDTPMRDPRPQLGWCVYTRLSIDDKKKLIGGNYARILKRATLPGHRLPRIVMEIDEQ